MPSVPWADPRCIFCREEKPLTKAHLIPEFLGGNLFAYNECKECNSELGSKVEAAIRKAPQIRLAAINLRDQLPDLEQRINNGQRYIAKQDDGTVVQFTRKGKEFRLRNQSEPGSRIFDDESAMKSIRADLIRAGRSSEEAEAFIAKVENAPAIRSSSSTARPPSAAARSATTRSPTAGTETSSRIARRR